MSLFKIYRNFILGLTVLFTTLSAFVFSGDAFAGKITSVSGKAWVLQSNRVKKQASVGNQFDNGDTLMTGARSFMQVEFIDGSKLNMVGKSELLVSDVSYEKSQGSANMDLESKGGLYQFFGGGIDKVAPSKFRMHTSNATIGIQGSSFSLKDELGKNREFSGFGVSLKLDQNRLTEVLKIAAEGKSGSRSKEQIKKDLKSAVQVFSKDEGPVSTQNADGGLEIFYPPRNEGQSSTVVTSIDTSGNVVHSVQNMSPESYFQGEATVAFGSSLPTGLLQGIQFDDEQPSEVVEDFYNEIKDAGEELSEKVKDLEKILNDPDSSLSDIVDEVESFAETLVDVSKAVSSANLDFQENIVEHLSLEENVNADAIKEAKFQAIDEKREVIDSIFDNQEKIIKDFKSVTDPSELNKLIDESQGVSNEGAKDLEKVDPSSASPSKTQETTGDQTQDTRTTTKATTVNTTTEALQDTVQKDTQENTVNVAQDDAVNQVENPIITPLGPSFVELLNRSSDAGLSQTGSGTYITDSGEVHTGDAYLFNTSGDFTSIQDEHNAANTPATNINSLSQMTSMQYSPPLTENKQAALHSEVIKFAARNGYSVNSEILKDGKGDRSALIRKQKQEIYNNVTLPEINELVTDPNALYSIQPLERRRAF